MNRRQFLSLSGKSLLGFLLTGYVAPLSACTLLRGGSYSIILLGDTHFDTEPADVYHSHYLNADESPKQAYLSEFARNGEMWRERCPRLMERARRLITRDTRMAMQMGDLIQGDCGNGEVHRKMLDDAMNNLQSMLGGIPLVTVIGNHDIRGTDARATYYDYMPKRISRELGTDVQKTTFSFRIGKDVFIFIDFNHPDDAEVERLFAESEDARYTFVVVHGPLFPMDSGSARWFYHGKDTPEENKRRRHFRQLFARRNVICFCGHTHTTELYDWFGDDGRITQMTLNSVWSRPELGTWKVNADNPSLYGTLRKGGKTDNDNVPDDLTALFDEYRPGLKRWIHSRSAGSYKLIVTPRHIFIDMWAGDSEERSQRFVLR
jgi:hypothetical protein